MTNDHTHTHTHKLTQDEIHTMKKNQFTMRFKEHSFFTQRLQMGLIIFTFALSVITLLPVNIACLKVIFLSSYHYTYRHICVCVLSAPFWNIIETGKKATEISLENLAT